ncbi:MAG: acyl-CoA dehydrogenase family protein, partial [Chromatiales bacterium]|nr:acyl-CoA dehydrogenase family protein [Chromatiales bacterium]
MFELNSAQIELRARARELAEGEFAPAAAEVDRTEAYPWHHIERLREANFMGMTIPREYGGQGATYLDATLVVEEISKACGTCGRISVEANMGAIGA